MSGVKLLVAMILIGGGGWLMYSVVTGKFSTAQQTSTSGNTKEPLSGNPLCPFPNATLNALLCGQQTGTTKSTTQGTSGTPPAQGVR